MGLLDRFKKSKASNEQREQLSRIVNRQQREGLLKAIEHGEAIPDYAWNPLPEDVDCVAIYRRFQDYLRSITAPVSDRQLVYGVMFNDLIFIPRARAIELAAIHDALRSSSTWGEFKKRVSADVYDEYLRLSGADELPDFDEFFDGERRSRPELTRDETLRAYRDQPADERRPEADDLFPGYDIRGAPSDLRTAPKWPPSDKICHIAQDWPTFALGRGNSRRRIWRWWLSCPLLSRCP